jgi:hypothetical protein
MNPAISMKHTPALWRFSSPEYAGLYCGSMRKGTDKERDAELIKRFQAEAPEVLDAKVDFDALVGNILSADVTRTSIGNQRKRAVFKPKAGTKRRTS